MVIALVGAYPLLWSVGLAFAFWPLMALAAINQSRKRESNTISNLLLLIGFTELVSIPIGALYFNVEFERILSAINNALVWITSSILISIKMSILQQSRLTNYILRIGIIQGALVLIAAIIFPNQLPIPFFRDLVGLLGVNASAFSDNQIVYIDWFDGASLRTSGMMAHATWAGGFSALCMILLFKKQKETQNAFYKYIFGYALLGFVVYLSLSRAVIVALTLSIIFALVFRYTMSKSTSIRVAGVVIASLLGLTVSIVGYTTNVFQEIISGLNQARSGSLFTRAEIYNTTLTFIKDHPFPLLGFGVKPAGQDLVASIGTHSTPLGVLFKGGVIGFCGYLILTLVSIKELLKKESYFGIAIFTFIALWSILEDFDGGHLIPLFLAIIYRQEFIKVYKATSVK